MENITTGHWVFALISLILYILFLSWGYWQEKKIYTVFNYKIIPLILYMGLILVLLIIIS